MTIFIDNNDGYSFDFSIEDLCEKALKEVLKMEGCEIECEVSLSLVDKETIRSINSEFRGIDKVTDVLSFPAVFYETPGDFSVLDIMGDEVYNLDSGNLMLGDVIICYDRMVEQAGEYGHSVKREFVFLFIHSILHLLGYDHELEEDKIIMEEKQRIVLDALKITRDD